MTGQPTDPALSEMLEQILAEHGLDLEGLEVSRAGRRRLVRVLADKDGGVTLDELADVSAVVGRRLDASAELGDAPYTLEVTSPGVDRPLTAPRHWRRNAGRLVRTQLTDGSAVEGRIESVGDEVVTLQVDGSERRLPLAEVASARVQVEFNRRASA